MRSSSLHVHPHVRLATNYNDSAPYKKSVEDVSEETRYILEEFIIERATEDGVDMGLVRPIIDVDLAARKHCHARAKERYSRVHLVPQYRQIQQIAHRLRMIGDELDADQRIRR